MYFPTQAKNNVSALELKRLIGVCYRSAWRVKHKLLEVMMTQREADRQLEGLIEVDDACLGGAHPGGKRGRGSQNKVPFIAAVQTDANGRPQLAVFSPVKTFRRADVQAWAGRHLAASSVVVSDGLDCFTAVAATGASHAPDVVGTKRKSSDMPCFKWINTVPGNLKTATSGTCHAFNFRKYGRRYLAQAQYRFNRRFDLSAILRRLLYAAAATGKRTEAALRMVNEDQRESTSPLAWCRSRNSGPRHRALADLKTDLADPALQVGGALCLLGRLFLRQLAIAFRFFAGLLAFAFGTFAPFLCLLFCFARFSSTPIGGLPFCADALLIGGLALFAFARSFATANRIAFLGVAAGTFAVGLLLR